jgi:hypothetical protein
MSRRLRLLALGLAVIAGACASPPPQSSVEFGSGRQFIPFVADSIDNVGSGPSLAVSSDGTPYAAYFGFQAELQPGQIAPSRPVSAPTLPSVDLTSVKDGIWTRGAVAIQAQIPNVTAAFGPAIVADVATMTPANVNGTAIAIDPAGALHVAWASDTGVWYAKGTGTAFTATQVTKIDPPLSTAGPLGAPSIAVDGTGAPWIAYAVTTGLGQQVTVATVEGDKWRTEVAATIPLAAGGGQQPSRTAIAVTGDGTPVVLYGDGANVIALTPGANGWAQAVVERGGLGAGLSATTSPDGTIVAAYYSGPEVHVALSPNGVAWTVGSAGRVEVTAGTPGLSTGVAVDGANTIYVTWYDPSTDSVLLVSGDGQTFTPAATDGTKGGSQPSLAATADGTVFLAWYDDTNQNLMLGGYGDVGGLELAVQSPTPTGPPSPPAPPPSQECEKV